MAQKTCDLCALCGISNCFRLLFHTQRQIAYALLTRPPLTAFLQFVRLECVRHAASVHPEPGSNSPVIIINRLPPDSCFLPERFSCSITFSSFSKFLFGIPCTFTFVFLPSISVLEILLFNFQRSCARSLPEVSSLSGRALLFYYFAPPLSSVFQKFFRLFFAFGKQNRFPVEAGRVL